jgi:hypothetical protein
VESFIVRVYGRRPDDESEPLGTVERVGSGERGAFSGWDQLVDTLLRFLASGEAVRGSGKRQPD